MILLITEFLFYNEYMKNLACESRHKINLSIEYQAKMDCFEGWSTTDFVAKTLVYKFIIIVYRFTRMKYN